MEPFEIEYRIQRIEERLEDICRRVEKLEELNRQHQASTRYTPHVDYRDVPFWETEEKSN